MIALFFQSLEKSLAVKLNSPVLRVDVFRRAGNVIVNPIVMTNPMKIPIFVVSKSLPMSRKIISFVMSGPFIRSSGLQYHH